MSGIKSISIPQACHESWQQMTPVSHGRHCQNCCKTVTDFTGMSNDEIINYLSGNRNVCGRFDEQQLNRVNNQFYTENLQVAGSWKRLALLLSLIGSTIVFKGNAQTKPVTVEQGTKDEAKPTHSFMLGKVAIIDSARYKTITGCVTDDNNEPIPGASIKLALNNVGVISDMNGDFKLSVPVSAKQFTVDFIGYSGQSVAINDDNIYHVKLRAQFMGEVVVVRQPFLKRIYYNLIKKPVQKIFN